MKRIIKLISLTLSVLMITTIFTAFSAGAKTKVSASGIKLSAATLTMTEGTKFTLKATVSPSNATNKTVYWKSVMPEVASVHNGGVIYAKKPCRKVTILAETNNGKRAVCHITIVKKGTPTGIKVNHKAITMTAGTKTTLLKAAVIPASAKNKTVYWKSTDPSVAGMQNGGVLTAKKAGTVTLTAKTNNGKTATCKVTVNAPKSSSHNHNWIIRHGNIRDGYACNHCYRDVTGWEDMYACHGGWHTHEWCDEPDIEYCTTCGAKRHLHNWTYIEPEFYHNSDEIRRRGYYFCWACFNFSEDGINTDNSHRLELNAWVTPYDFSGVDYYVGFGSKDPVTDPLDKLKSISVSGIRSMSVGDESVMKVSYYPKSTRCDRSLKWSSSAPSVVSVDANGRVTAKKEGTAYIKAVAFNNVSSDWFIRVTKNNVGVLKSFRVLIDGNDVTDGSVTISKNDKHKVTIVTEPAKAVYEVRFSCPQDFYTVRGCSGNISQYSWEHGIEYTNPYSEITPFKKGCEQLKVETQDINGNKIIHTVSVTVI